MVESNQRENKQVGSCPVMLGISRPHSSSTEDITMKDGSDRLSYNSPYPSCREFIVNTAVPPSPRMREIMEGVDKPGDSGNPPEPPPWLDRNLFNRGREFYKKYLFSICFSDQLSLILLFSIPRALNPLIFTGRSDTPEKALKRYFSTLLHVITWYTGDVWDPNDRAHKDVLSVRSVHKKVANLFNSPYNIDRVIKATVTEKGHEEPKCPIYPSIRDDMRHFAESMPENPVSGNYASQMDMSITQYSFIGLLVAHPSKLGAGAVTDGEFEALIHFWRGIGWLLGIHDDYNFCRGNLSETRALCLEVERFFVVPNLAEVDWNFEHMSASLISGIGLEFPTPSFPAMFRYLADLIGVSVPNFVTQMSFIHLIHYWLIRLVFALIYIIPGIEFVLTKCFMYNIEQTQKKLAVSSSSCKESSS